MAGRRGSRFNVTIVSQTNSVVRRAAEHTYKKKSPNQHSHLFFKWAKIWEAVGGKWRLEFGGSMFLFRKSQTGTRGRGSGKSLR